MRRFRFRAERLLGLRRQTLRMEQASLARALQQLKAAEAGWQHARGALGQAEQALAQLLARPAAGGEELLGRLELAAEARRRLGFQEQRRREALEQVEAQRQRLVEARRGVRVLERLRERRLAEYRQEVLRNEARWLDEVAGAAFWRERLGVDGRALSRETAGH